MSRKHHWGISIGEIWVPPSRISQIWAPPPLQRIGTIFVLPTYLFKLYVFHEKIMGSFIIIKIKHCVQTNLLYADSVHFQNVNSFSWQIFPLKNDVYTLGGF